LLRRSTVSELLYLDRPKLAVVDHWSSDFSTILLGHVWRGYDLMRRKMMPPIDVTMAEDDVERNLSELLEPEIQISMRTGDEPFYVQHAPHERETRKGGKAEPPEYDIAFVLYENPRYMWPLEAKVLKTDSEGSAAQYARAVNEQFLTCRYAPFSKEGAMLGYLLSGDPDEAFRSIEKKVPCTLTHHPEFPMRPHKTSDHKRKVPPGKESEYPSDFRCHHLIMKMAA
jgi:hypothetical protein